jgi:hypothetical protein
VVQSLRSLTDLDDAFALRHGLAGFGPQGLQLSLLDRVEVLRILLGRVEGLFRLAVVAAVVLLLPDLNDSLHHGTQCGVLIPLRCR